MHWTVRGGGQPRSSGWIQQTRLCRALSPDELEVVGEDALDLVEFWSHRRSPRAARSWAAISGTEGDSDSEGGRDAVVGNGSASEGEDEEHGDDILLAHFGIPGEADNVGGGREAAQQSDVEADNDGANESAGSENSVDILASMMEEVMSDVEVLPADNDENHGDSPVGPASSRRI